MTQLARDSREVKKYKAIRRSLKRLEQRLEMIDWEEDVLLPEVSELMAGNVRAEIGSISDFVDAIVIEEPDAAANQAHA